MTRAYLGLGSNIGCKVGNLRRAVRLISRIAETRLVQTSSFYRTAPLGITDQDWFVNAAACIETSLAPRALLDACLGVELEMGRLRKERWGPRLIDVDVLLFGDAVAKEEGMQLPHPRLLERAFALRPLLELDPDLAVGSLRVARALDGLEDQGVVQMRPVVAVVGASDKPERYAFRAQKLLMDRGHAVCPVTPRGGSVLGVDAVDDLRRCSSPVDTATLYVASSRVATLEESLLEAMPRRVVFNPGTENQALRHRLSEAGIEAIEACTLVMLSTDQW